MNFLAHAYLSFDDPEILVGNMISDFVKGKKKFEYPPGIQKGISLHRIIDTYTDDHPATKRAKEIFRPHYRLYSGAFIDVVYDHFLAIDPAEFNESSLKLFSSHVYAVLERYKPQFPTVFAGMFPYMKQQDWLFNYSTREGTGKSMQGVVRRAAYLSESMTAYKLFLDNYQLLHDCYRLFWADLKLFIHGQYLLLNGKD